jgi:hypothetical protein
MPRLAHLLFRVAAGREGGFETGLGIIMHGMIMINTKKYFPTDIWFFYFFFSMAV